MTKKIFKLIVISFVIFGFYSCEQEEIKTEPDSRLNINSENNISLEFARNISDNILFESENKQSNTKERKSINAISDENSEILYYVINYKGGGYVILAGDNRSKPILSYSENHNFKIDKEYPEGLEDWLEFAQTQMQEIRVKKLTQTKEIKAQWESFINKRKINITSLKTDNVLKKEDPIGPCQDESEQVGPLLTTTWNQGCGFNNLLPSLSCSDECGRVLAGCVPIAMAQVMKYYNHPSSYNWSYMSLHNGTPETQRLIKDIHDAIPVQYSCDVTGVSSSYDIGYALRTYFNYSTASQSQTNYYAETSKENLRYGRPLIFSGSGSGAHMWVCDGFRRNKICMDNGMAVDYLFLHMNWGWQYPSIYNGWYSYDNFNPGNSNYNNNIRVVSNIKP